MLKQLFITVLFLSFALTALAQHPDSTFKPKPDAAAIKRDTMGRGSFAPKIKKEKVYHPDSTHIPSVAVKRSLIVPGLGQIYNRKYWKVPLIYGGLGLLTAAVISNQRNYQVFTALAQIVNANANAIPVPTDKYYSQYQKYKAEYQLYVVNRSAGYTALADAANGSERNRDISILSILAVWGVQTIDAYIDAKFISSYTVDDKLSFKVTPGLINQQPVYAANFSNAYIPGIKIIFTLR